MVIHLLGDIYLEDSTSGSCDQNDSIRNNLEMKRTFRNKATMRRMMMAIWSLGLVDIKETRRDVVL
jgi:hypothetical protein